MCGCVYLFGLLGSNKRLVDPAESSSPGGHSGEPDQLPRWRAFTPKGPAGDDLDPRLLPNKSTNNTLQPACYFRSTIEREQQLGGPCSSSYRLSVIRPRATSKRIFCKTVGTGDYNFSVRTRYNSVSGTIILIATSCLSRLSHSLALDSKAEERRLRD